MLYSTLKPKELCTVLSQGVGWGEYLLLKECFLHSLFFCLSPGFCMFVLSLVKKHYRLQFYMVWLNRGWLPPVGGRMMNNIGCLEMLCR